MLFVGKHRSPVDWLDAEFHHRELGKRLLYFGERLLYFGETTFIFWRKAFIFPRRAFIFWRVPLWRYGGLDSANSANKVAR